MAVRTGAWMDRVSFTTNKGRSFQAGGGGGDFYQLQMTAPKGQQSRVVAIGGTHFDYMESLYAHYAVVEKESSKNEVEVLSDSNSETKSII